MKLFLAISTILLLTFQSAKTVFVVKDGARNVLECGTLRLQFELLEQLSFTSTGQVHLKVQTYKTYEVKNLGAAYKNASDGLANQLTQSVSEDTNVVVRIPIPTTNFGKSIECSRIWQESFCGTGTFTFVEKSQDGNVPAHVNVVIQLNSEKTLIGRNKFDSVDPGKQVKQLLVTPTAPLVYDNGTFVYFGNFTVDNNLSWSIAEKDVEFNEENITDEEFSVDGVKKQLTLLSVRYTNMRI